MAATSSIDTGQAGTRTRDVLAVLAPQMAGEDEAQKLQSALALYTEISQVIRLCLENRFEPEEAPVAFRELLLKTCNCEDIGALEAHLKQTAGTVRQIFERTIGSVDGEPV